MSLPTRSPIPSLIPDHAPFTVEQRTWLNGLFAGLLSLDGGVVALSPEQAAALTPDLLAGALVQGPVADIDDGVPWHDPAMPLAERMKLAEGRPLQRRLMAAMAQQDCGQCGYNCYDYSNALVAGSEKRLNLCVPGGKETSRMVKTLYAEREGSLVAPVNSTPASAAETTARFGSRDCPVEATFASRTRLNKPGSLKESWHIEFDFETNDLEYTVGDSLGVFPANDLDLVDAVIAAIEAPPSFPIGDRTLRETLFDSVSLAPAPDMLFQLISYLVGGERRKKAQALAAGGDPDGDADTLDVLAAIEKFRGIRPDPEAFVEALDPLQPRVYSIASSSKVDPRRVALTVDAVRYPVGGRMRLGVASTYLASRASVGQKLKVYTQKAQHFALPADPGVPIIMVGPGTGVAPFRAFLHERMATKAAGRNWLFFGHQRRDYDFFYEDELIGMRSAGLLTRLTLAWSRDAEHKIYVQDRMREVGRDLWAWLAEGAHLYVCGDAKKMAKDVESALIDIVAAHGARTQEEAFAFVVQLKKSGRYQQDVY